MIRCYITDRRHCSGDLLDRIEACAHEGVELIQLREKDLSAREMIALARAALGRVEGSLTKLLINTRADIAIASGAHGVHLPSGSASVAEWRRLLPHQLIGVSCHSAADVRTAADADYVLYGPVFETPRKGAPVGLDELGAVARLTAVPVLALGGITWENAQECIRAGAAGVAGIRLFQR
ncbi:MAG: thiamine phosphate synthase [Bryobacteraceae bacterium]|nr:thiamine phosphate synthase [Bryobacteraceae bacterium]